MSDKIFDMNKFRELTWGSKLKGRVSAQLATEDTLPPDNFLAYIYVSNYKLRTKRLRKKFLKNPYTYLPRWFVGMVGADSMVLFLRRRLEEKGLSRCIFSPEPVKDGGYPKTGTGCYNPNVLKNVDFVPKEDA